MRIPPHCLVATFIILLLSFGTLDAERKETHFGVEIIERLIAPETRTAALREIQIAQQSEQPIFDWAVLPVPAFEIYHKNIQVTLCPQVNPEEPLYLITYQSDHEAFYDSIYSPHSSHTEGHVGFEPVPSEYKPASVLIPKSVADSWQPSLDFEHLAVPPQSKIDELVYIFLTHDGQITWPFSGANSANGDVLLDMTGDGLYERAYASNYGLYDRRKGDPDIRVEGIRINTVEAESKTLLNIVFNWHPSNQEGVSTWGWMVEDIDEDGRAEIVIGPIADKHARPEPEVIFRWDIQTQQYVGPSGSLEEHFIVLDPTIKVWEQLQALREAGGLQYATIAANERSLVEVEDAPTHDWKTRVPYVHTSLASATDEMLLDFMCGWRLQDDGLIKPNDSVAPGRHFEFQKEWFSEPPKDAVFTLLEENQSDTHRDKYTLYYPTNLTEPEEFDWLVLNTVTRRGVDVIRMSEDKLGEQLSGEYSRPLPERYPYGDFKWKWSHAQIKPEYASWLSDTLWWLAQIRSEPKSGKQDPRQSRGFVDSCYTSGLESEDPNIRLLLNSGNALLDISSPRPNSGNYGWKNAYNQDHYMGLVRTVFDAVVRHHTDRRARELSIREVWERYPNLLEQIEQQQLPPELVRLMIRCVGDEAAVDMLPQLRAIETWLSTPSAIEQEWARLHQELAALASGSGIENYKAKMALNKELDALRSRFRAEQSTWLREPLAFSIRQLEAADDIEKLESWAKQAGQPGALWAFHHLKATDPERVLAVQHALFIAEPKWRSRLLSNQARENPELARSWLNELPRDTQLPLITALVKTSNPEELDAELIADLLEAVTSEGLDPSMRSRALDELMTRQQPNALPDPEIDAALQTAMAQEVEKGVAEDWYGRRLRYQLAEFLLLRDNIEVRVPLYLQAADLGVAPFSSESFLPLLVHLSVEKQSAEARAWLVAWVDEQINNGLGHWDQITTIIYTADLDEYDTFLSKLATRELDEPEGANAKKMADGATLAPDDRYHLARQMIATRAEDDALTQAKCQVLLTFRLNDSSNKDGLYTWENRLKSSFHETYEMLNDAERAALLKFVEWCNETIDRNTLGYRNREYLKKTIEWLKAS